MDELIYEDLDTLPGFSPKFPGEDYYNYSSFIGEGGTFYFSLYPGNDPTQQPNSYAHLDPIMRYFVYLCHVNSMFTTAGWLGISDPPLYFDKLKSQEREAQRSGLKLINFMNGEEIVFKDPKYRVEWGKASDMVAIGDQAQYDRIGLLVAESDSQFIQNLQDNPYATGLASIEQRKVLDVDGFRFEHFCISVRHEKEARKEEWSRLTAHIMSNLGKKMKIYESNNSR